MSDIGFDIIKPAAADLLATKQRDVVLPENSTRKVAKQNSDFETNDFTIDPGHELPGGAFFRIILSERFERSQHFTEGIEIGVDPIDAIECQRGDGGVWQRDTDIGLND